MSGDAFYEPGVFLKGNENESRRMKYAGLWGIIKAGGCRPNGYSPLTRQPPAGYFLATAICIMKIPR